MRLFIAAELSNSLQHAAARAADWIQERVQTAAPHSRIRWVPAVNLHVTIWFLGEVAEAKAETVVRALRQPLGVPPVALRLEGAGAFPASGEPRTLWLGLTSGREGLIAVHDRLTPRLQKLGFEPERRQFSPHLTIARVKEARRSEVAAIRRVLHEADDVVGECQLASVTLFRSTTAPTGSRYEVLLHAPLSDG